jgi:anti-anti-sigma factor
VPHDDSTTGLAADGQPFVCSRTRGAVDVGWVRIAGALDSTTAPRLSRTLRERRLRASLVVLDLRELTFLDWSGVHAVVEASIRARRAGRRVVLMHGAPQVKRMFAQAGSSEHVEVADLHLVEPSVRTSLPPAGGDRAA